MARKDFKLSKWYSELDEELTEFAEHPIKASDVVNTRNASNFHDLYNRFIRETSRLFIDYLHLAVAYDGDKNFIKCAREILTFVEDTIYSIRGWETATGNCLIHHNRSSDGQLRLHLSVLNLLRTVNRDYTSRTLHKI